MAPHADAPIDDEDVVSLPGPSRPTASLNPPRVLIIGAGSRGFAYARCVKGATNGIIVGIAEPIAYKRQRLGENFIWGKGNKSSTGQEFTDWKDFLAYEQERREEKEKGEDVPEGVDAVFICVLDEMHKDVIVGLAPLRLHIMCEKPLATSLQDCVQIYKSLLPDLPERTAPGTIFSIGHVLRYSQHNMLLRKLLLEEKVIGEIMSINHTEPVGWWHFTHSYVRGNWRKESTTAPSLLTKSCHDIDFILWLLCSPAPNSTTPAHIPTTVSSSGALQYFNRTRKPTAAGSATNCLSCPIESTCKYSAKKVYLGSELRGLGANNIHWPVNIVVPEIEELVATKGIEAGNAAITKKLAENYGPETSIEEIEGKNWFGRCVYEADNDVNDEQVVTITWENDPLPPSSEPDPEKALVNRGAKTAIFHMVAHTTRICKRHSSIYGSDGEIYADNTTITVDNFNTGKKKTYRPWLQEDSGHGGGDSGLTRQFIDAVDAVKNKGRKVEDAQREYVGCSLEEIIRSHGMVFAAEEARKGKKVVGFAEWWREEVEKRVLS